MKNISFQKDGLVFNFQFETSNSKTGDMVQNYILPVEWISTDIDIKKLGDKQVCFDCDHSMEKNNTCYVRKGNAMQGLLSKVRSFRKKGIDSIPEYSEEIANQIIEKVTGRGVRFGAYGEPVLLGEDLIKRISERASYWTGYTHQWHRFNWASRYFMASVESNLLARAADAMGFRSFFVTDSDDSNYVTCPASKEAGRLTTCENCKLCMGTQSKAKSVKIKFH